MSGPPVPRLKIQSCNVNGQMMQNCRENVERFRGRDLWVASPTSCSQQG